VANSYHINEETMSDLYLIARIETAMAEYSNTGKGTSKYNYSPQEQQNWIALFHRGIISKKMLMEHLGITEEDIAMSDIPSPYEYKGPVRTPVYEDTEETF